MNNFDSWIGKKEIQNDVSDLRPLSLMQALLNQENKLLDHVPHLYHWLYFVPVVDTDQLAIDGHPHKGSFLPPIPFPKRMWAGGRLEFIAPIAINQPLRRESEILNVSFKQGKVGDLYFVTVKHSIYSNDELCIIEEQDIVYKAEQAKTVADSAISEKSVTELRPATYRVPFKANTPCLFRYSALTFNSHKIHYDREYSMTYENYPGLVVHGPLLATLLIHTFKQKHPNKKIQKFNFRAVKPVFDFNEIHICGDIQNSPSELWIEHSNGDVAMKATIEFQGE